MIKEKNQTNKLGAEWIHQWWQRGVNVLNGRKDRFFGGWRSGPRLFLLRKVAFVEDGLVISEMWTSVYSQVLHS